LDRSPDIRILQNDSLLQSRFRLMDIELLFARVNYQNFVGFNVNIRLLNVCVVSVFELSFHRYFW